MGKAFILTIALSVMSIWPELQRSAPADEPPESAPQYQLDVIITTAFRESEQFFSTVEEIPAQDLEERNVISVAQALNLLPGLHTGVARVGHGEYVFLRGFEQQHVLILLDGVPIYNPYDGLLELDHLPTNHIQSIRVVKGSGSVIHGPNALGGVIRIITKNPLELPHSNAAVEASENGTFGLRLSSNWQINSWRFHLSGSRNRSDGFRLPNDYRETEIPNLPETQKLLSYEDGGWRDNSHYTKDAAHLNLTYLPTERFRLDVSGGLVNNRWGVPPHPIYNPNNNKSRVRYWRFNEWRQNLFSLTTSARPKDHVWVQTVLFYNMYDNTLDGYDDDTYSSQEKPYAFHSVYDDRALGGHFHINTLLGRAGTATVGAGVIGDSHRDTPDRGEPTDDYENRTWWVGLENRIQISKKVSATVGINYSLLRKIKAARLGDVGGDLSAANPSISLAGLISSTARLYLSWAQLSRFPSIKQLYGQDGNPQLDVQSSHHAEMGVEWAMVANGQLRGSVFFDQIHDLIEGNYTSPTMVNIPEAFMLGAEVTVQVQLTAGSRALLGYSYLQARNKSEGRPGDYLQYRPEHQLHWSLSVELPWNSKLHFDGSAFSNRYFYNDFYQGRLNHLSAYGVGNLMFQKHFSFGLEPFLGIANILDTSYQHVYTSPAPGRQIRAGMRMTW